MSEPDRKIDGVLGLLAVVLVAGSLAAADLPGSWRNWSHFREVDVGADREMGELLSVLVPEDLYERARSDLADLRLIDQHGDEIGYVLHSPGRGPDVEWRNVETSDSGVVPGRYSQIVADTGGGGAIHSSVEVTLANGEGEIFTWVEVAASEDRETWRIVRRRAPLYRFNEEGYAGPAIIRYPPTHDRWLRLRLLEEEGEIRVAKLRVAETGEDDVPLVAIRRGLALRPDSPPGESWWEPHGTMPLVPVAGVRLATGSEEFQRPVTVSTSDDGETWRIVGRGQIYRFRAAAGEEAPQRQSLEVGVREAAARYWRVGVMDRGDAPIDDLEVSLLRDRKTVVFKSAAGPLRLLYGNHLAAAPEYELTKLTTRSELAAAGEAELLREQSNDAYLSPEPFTERHPIILWAALGLAVLVVGGLALKALR